MTTSAPDLERLREFFAAASGDSDRPAAEFAAFVGLVEFNAEHAAALERLRLAAVRARESWARMFGVLGFEQLRWTPPPTLAVERRARRAALRRRYRKRRPTGYTVRAMRRRGELAAHFGRY